MGHLEPRSLKSTLDIEALIVLAAVQDCLVATRLFGDEVESLDDSKTQFLPLLVLRNSDVFDVSDLPKAVNAGVRRPR